MPMSQQISAVVWGLTIGLALLTAIYFTIRGAWFRAPQHEGIVGDMTPEPVQPVHDYPGGVAEAHGPVPIIIKLIIVSVLVWTVIYVIMFAQSGFNFS